MDNRPITPGDVIRLTAILDASMRRRGLLPDNDAMAADEQDQAETAQVRILLLSGRKYNL